MSFHSSLTRPIAYLVCAGVLVASLTGCETVAQLGAKLPSRSSAAVTPSPKKTAEAFAADKAACTAIAQNEISAQRNENVVADVVTTVGSAAAGALGGGLTASLWGHAGRGAVLGAIGGGVTGASISTMRGFAGESEQGVFDRVFWACMQERGHTLSQAPIYVQ